MGSPLMETLLRRRSVRKFRRERVPVGVIKQCLEAVPYAPSACNAQPWRVVVVDDPDLRRRLSERAFSGVYSFTGFAAEAPVLMVLLTRFDWFVQAAGRRIQGTHFHLLDAGIAGEHLVLRATELGLGTCWIGWFSRRKVRRVLSIPRRYRLCAMIALGWPAEDLTVPEKRRLEVDEIASFNSAAFKDA